MKIRCILISMVMDEHTFLNKIFPAAVQSFLGFFSLSQDRI